MIERHVTFNVLPGKETEFAAFTNGPYRAAMSKMPGYEKLELLRESENPGQYQMVIRFTDADKAKAWRDSEAHATLKPAMKALHSGSTVVVYDVID
jgi:antibiotic biosynthesis monooxygenase (ABM) superfamily enzyme